MAEEKNKEENNEEEEKEEQEASEEEEKEEAQDESSESESEEVEENDSDDDSSGDSEESDDEGEEDDEEDFEVPEEFEDIISQIEEMSVVELADLVKSIEKKFGVSAAAPAAAGGAGGAGGGGGQDSFDVVITDPGQSKIQVIKAVKEITGKGLKESKSMVEDTPATIKEGLSEDEAEDLQEQLEEAGATVELQ